MKLSLFLSLFFLCISSTVFSQENEVEPVIKKHPLAFNGYSGGMQLHIGYVQGQTFNVYGNSGNVIQQITPKGITTGIGGSIRFHFGNYWRVGTEGYVSTLTFGENKSSSRLGWGGLLNDVAFKVGRFIPFFGVTIGGGNAKNLLLLNPTPDDYIVENESVSYRSYGFMAVDPFIGVEFKATRRLNLLLKMDYLMNVTNIQDDFVTGPRLYFGFIFCHL